MNGAEIIEAYRNQSERSLEEMIDFELSKLQTKLDAIYAQPIRGWLITGSRRYQDTIETTEDRANNRIRSRGENDSSYRVALIELQDVVAYKKT